MRVAAIPAILIALSCAHGVQSTAVPNAPQLRVIEFGDHPDPNTGTPKVIEAAQPWPIDVPALLTAVKESTGRKNSVFDMRHAPLAADAVEQLEETNVRVLQLTPAGARVLVRMESSPTAVEAFVPQNGTAVIGSDSVDEHHAYVAVSLIGGESKPEVFSVREPGVTAPVKISGALPPATPTAIEHHLRGVMVETQIDENGNVVAARALMGKYPSDSDERTIEDTVRTWKFKPATRNGMPVAVLTNVTVDYAHPSAQQPVAWHSYTAPDGSFTVDFPMNEPRTRDVMIGDRNAIPRSDYTAFVDRNTFMVEVFKSEHYTRDRAAEDLRDYPNPGAAGLHGQVVESAEINNAGYPGRFVRMEGTVDAGPGKVIMLDRAYIANGRMYLITVATAPGVEISPLAQHFLESFQIVK